MTYENYVKGHLLAYALAQGARHGGYKNTLAVAHVIANRVRAGWQGGNWLEVIDSAVIVEGTKYATPFITDPRDISFRTAQQRIDDIYTGVAETDLVSIQQGLDGPRIHALYYCELDHVDSAWFANSILRGHAIDHPRIATVGSVTFFG